MSTKCVIVFTLQIYDLQGRRLIASDCSSSANIFEQAPLDIFKETFRQFPAVSFGKLNRCFKSKCDLFQTLNCFFVPKPNQTVNTAMSQINQKM